MRCIQGCRWGWGNPPWGGRVWRAINTDAMNLKADDPKDPEVKNATGLGLTCPAGDVMWGSALSKREKGEGRGGGC